MGRSKTYEREALVDRAVELFRSHGFASTSASMLEERLGVNRSSIYAEFGSKQELFDAALERYRETVVDQRFAPLAEPGAGIEAIMAVFDFYGAAGDGPVSGRGCLLCNTAIELGPDDPTGTRAVPRYLDRISSAFKSALDDAVRKGEIRDSVDTTLEAQFLTATVLGIFVMLRAATAPTAVSAAAAAATHHVASLKP
ncbi:MAG: TetR/AcrR family transcriptional regulator [Acidimicrobiia bacterium]|nr:TetR/AcrR family transcriptional regulator [Acidimicrobiia bacterium]